MIIQGDYFFSVPSDIRPSLKAITWNHHSRSWALLLHTPRRERRGEGGHRRARAYVFALPNSNFFPIFIFLVCFSGGFLETLQIANCEAPIGAEKSGENWKIVTVRKFQIFSFFRFSKGGGKNKKGMCPRRTPTARSTCQGRLHALVMERMGGYERW